MAQNVNSADFQTEVLDYKGIVLVDFWAVWCGPCIALGPVIEELAEELKDKAKVVKVSIVENQDLAEKYQVRGIPNVKIFKDGVVVKDLVGMMPKSMYIQAVEEASK